MKKIIIAIIILIIIGIGVGGGVINQNSEKIKIGAVISLTGFAAPWGEYSRNGINLAVDEINRNGGIDGRKVEVIIEDDHTEGKDAVLAYNKLLSVDRVDAVIGGTFDFTAQPLLPLAESNKIALISPSNFRIPGSFELNDHSFVMLTNFSKVIRKLEAYVKKENVKKLAVIHFQSGFGNEIAKTLDLVMKEAGQEGIVNEEYAQIGNNDFKTAIAKLKAKNVDTVFLDMVDNDPVNFLTQAKQLNFRPRVIGYSGITDSFTRMEDKTLLEGVVILNWEISSEKFREIYFNKYASEPAKSADKSYAAVYVLVNAIAKTSSRDEVAKYIKDNTFKILGNDIKFTDDHTVENIDVEIGVIKDGQFVKVE